MNITPLNNLEKFNQFLFNQIELDLYKYKFLNDIIEKVKTKQNSLYDSSVINISANGWILIIHSEILLIYGENWNVNQFSEINEVFDLNKYTNFELAGDYDLIDELIKFYKPKNFEIQKERFFYHANKINIFNKENLRIRKASIFEVDELAVMLQEYYHEEYNGLNDKNIEDMQERIIPIIHKEKIYVLFNENEILLSFCTIIDPDIGILFTKKEFRNKGYGKVILSFCSSLLQARNDSVYIMTDKDKIESNIVCEKVGFLPYYKYKAITINCG